MTSAVSLQLDSKELGEQLTKIFPKCRPRDLNLNHLHSLHGTVRHDASHALDNNAFVMELRKEMTRFGEELDETGQEEEDNESGESASSSSDEDLNNDDDMAVDHSCGSEGQVIVLQSSKGATYKLRDSRIIEIAGGRELFSASRSKALRTKQVKAVGTEQGNAPERKTSSRGHGNRELTETVFSTEVHSVKLQRDIGGAVVFDDIEEPVTRPWRRDRCDRRDSAGSSPSPPSYHQTPSDFFKQVTSSLHDMDGKYESTEGKSVKMIGGLAIAEYEGSPRRYGPRPPESGGPTRSGLPSAQSLLASPSVCPPRPGFAQRVVVADSPTQQPGSPAVSPADPPANSTFDYLYEFSETRKVLEEFFKHSDTDSTKHDFQDFDELGYELRRQAGKGSAYVGLRLAKNIAQQEAEALHKTDAAGSRLENDGADLSLDSVSTEDLGDTEVGLQVGHSRNFTLSPETTDCESNCGDLDSEVSLLLMDNDGHPQATVTERGDGSGAQQQDSLRIYSAMPVLEDGLSSGHASDTDNNNPSLVLMKRQMNDLVHRPRPGHATQTSQATQATQACPVMNGAPRMKETRTFENDLEIEALDPLGTSQTTPPPPAPVPHRSSTIDIPETPESVEAALKDIRQTLQRTKTLPGKNNASETTASPIWVPRRQTRDVDSDSRKSRNGDDLVVEEEEADTDLETDRLLGQQRTDDHGFYDDKGGWKKPKSRTVMPASVVNPSKVTTPQHEPPDTSPSPIKDEAAKPKKEKEGGKKKGRNKEVLIHDPSVLIEGVLFRARYLGSTQLVCEGQPTKSTRMMQAEEAVSRIKAEVPTPMVLEGLPMAPSPGIPLPGTVFRLLFLGSVEVDEEAGRKRRKRLKKTMVEEAVTKIKAPEGETQPSTEVDLFISTEKIMVLNTDLKEIMMDHALRTISYIADIGDLVVLMARRRYVPHDVEDPGKFGRAPKMICHVFESEEAQFIAQSIGQAFQVAYMEFLKANGIEDHSFVKEMDYQEVLNSQEIFGDELQMFAKKEMQKEVVVPKAKGEILGVVIVESGWGSMLPTVVIANLAPAGAAARCGHLNIGDQIIAINGVSLVGLPLSTCQTYIKNTKNQTVVKLTVVPCAPVVEVKIKRPDTKYQLGFSVQNGVICSLLRGGIAERGGVRVGHRIIEINNQSVVAVPHEKIVNLLATSVGEILMKTMPTSMFRLLTGQETPLYI